MQVLLSILMFRFVLATSTLNEANGKDVEIFRAERDRFTNIARCNETNAVCFDKDCTYCQCMVDETYIRTRDQYGKCVSNELLVYATADESSFLVQNNLHKFCLYQQPYKNANTFVLVRSCSEDNWDDRWIWTNYGQLLNLATLECMTDDFVSADKHQHYLTMKKFDRNNQKQLWKCVGDKKYDIMQLKSGRYMYMTSTFVTTKNIQSEVTKWTRFDSDKDVCSQAVGCETFADGSSLVILNKTKCQEQSACLGEKAISLSKTRCILLPNRTQYLHNDTWKPLETTNGSFGISSSGDKVYLKWNLESTQKSWGGLMVKVQFMCEDAAARASKIEHCVVIKYTGSFKGFKNIDDDEDGNGENGDGDDGDDGDGDDDKDGDDKDGDDKDVDKDGDGNGGDKNKDKTDTDNDQETNAGDKNNTQTIIIIVCVLAVLFLTGIIVFIIYRYRHRCVSSRKGNTEKQDHPPKEEYADAMNPLYPANNNLTAQRECELYESTPDHVYQYVDVDHKTASPPPQNLTYDYAVVDGPMNKSERSSADLDVIEMEGTSGGNHEGLTHDRGGHIGETKDRAQSTKPPPHKYHVLEEP